MHWPTAFMLYKMNKWLIALNDDKNYCKIGPSHPLEKCIRSLSNLRTIFGTYRQNVSSIIDIQISKFRIH